MPHGAVHKGVTYSFTCYRWLVIKLKLHVWNVIKFSSPCCRGKVVYIALVEFMYFVSTLTNRKFSCCSMFQYSILLLLQCCSFKGFLFKSNRCFTITWTILNKNLARHVILTFAKHKNVWWTVARLPIHWSDDIRDQF